MTSLGIDLGGTKIEAQLFDGGWTRLDRQRIDTPTDYSALLDALSGLVRWADQIASQPVDVGIGSAGLLNPRTGTVIAGNLPSHGQRFPNDLNTAIGRPVTYLNDCKALALSEAVFGAGRPYNVTLSLVLGTGVSAGVTRSGNLVDGASGTLGEIGQLPVGGKTLAQHGLATGDGPWCYEGWISGPGLRRLGRALAGQDRSGADWTAALRDDPTAQRVWSTWCALTAELLHTLVLTIDPDCIILGGGLSRVDNVVSDLFRALGEMQFDGFACPPILLAEGGDSSGARGAAYAALKSQG